MTSQDSTTPVFSRCVPRGEDPYVLVGGISSSPSSYSPFYQQKWIEPLWAKPGVLSSGKKSVVSEVMGLLSSEGCRRMPHERVARKGRELGLWEGCPGPHGVSPGSGEASALPCRIEPWPHTTSPHSFTFLLEKRDDRTCVLQVNIARSPAGAQ